MFSHNSLTFFLLAFITQKHTHTHTLHFGIAIIIFILRCFFSVSDVCTTNFNSMLVSILLCFFFLDKTIKNSASHTTDNFAIYNCLFNWLTENRKSHIFRKFVSISRSRTFIKCTPDNRVLTFVQFEISYTTDNPKRCWLRRNTPQPKRMAASDDAYARAWLRWAGARGKIKINCLLSSRRFKTKITKYYVKQFEIFINKSTKL